MVPYKRQDEYKLIAALLNDIHMSHGVVFNTSALRNTTKVVESRLYHEGIGFLTKSLPKLAKAMDIALCGTTKLSATKYGFAPMRNSELPRFLGEFFQLVFLPDGMVRENPCASSVRVLRDILYVFYKYELPYTKAQEQDVIDQFVKTESDICTIEPTLKALGLYVDTTVTQRRRVWGKPHVVDLPNIVREARILLARVFRDFDCKDIVPSHGPGAVATKQQLWEKYEWTNVSHNIRSIWPLDEYFFSSLSHVCDRLSHLHAIDDRDLPARVILVPKDSRGPRLISCEPVDYQWIQQGLMRRLVNHVESCCITKYNVFFTDQTPNQRGALLGSITGRYATLDLKEASDRVSLELVRLLFPAHVYEWLAHARSASTTLPDGSVVTLRKFAPMGSALCFPILALTVWSILSSACPDADTRDSILVYGDDVIVPTAYAVNAMKRLESFGLKVNLDKSCIRGSFRESCGVDAFKGLNVTPLRLRTVWSSARSPDGYTSWIAYANAMYARGWFRSYDLVVSWLTRVYGFIPSKSDGFTDLSLADTAGLNVRGKFRTNHRLQKRQCLVWDVSSPTVRKDIDGWSMLLRYFTAGARPPTSPVSAVTWDGIQSRPFSVSAYTRRKTSMLVKRWR